jgi:hypothetical protein
MKKSAVAVCAGVLFVAVVGAPAAIITQNTWSVAGSLGGWTNSGSPVFGTLSWQNGVLRSTGGDPGGSPKVDYIYDTDDLLGNYRAFPAGAKTSVVEAIRFGFSPTGGGFTNSTLQLYFVNGANEEWYYDMAVASGWNTYYANLDFSSGWYTMDAGRFNSTYFFNDLTNVTQVGIVLNYPLFLTGQYYELDDFQLLDNPIPEPGTYAVLTFALLSLGITFRRRLKTRFSFLPSDRQS